MTLPFLYSGNASTPMMAASVITVLAYAVLIYEVLIYEVFIYEVWGCKDWGYKVKLLGFNINIRQQIDYFILEIAIYLSNIAKYYP